MGPGPSDVAPSVLGALAQPTLGHRDPVFLRIMDEVRERLRAVMRTTNAPACLRVRRRRARPSAKRERRRGRQSATKQARPC